MNRTFLLLLAGIAFASVACGENGVVPSLDVEPATLHFLSDRNVTDTAQSVLTAILFEVRNKDGEPIPGIRIRFEPTGMDIGNFVQFEAAGGTIATTTDPSGVAGVRGRLGTVPGPARLLVTVGGSQLSDSIGYTILPGAGHQLLISPQDTAVYVGNAFDLDVTIVDRHGNPVVGTPMVWTSSEAITLTPLSASGSTATFQVTGSEWGRARIHMGGAGVSDTAAVSVVPQGTVSLHRRSGEFNDQNAMIVTNLDGSNFRALWTTLHGSEYEQSWLGNDIIYQEGKYSDARLFIADAQGDTRRLLPEAAEGTAGYTGGEGNAQVSRDGQWIYFEGGDDLWRVRPDGSDLQSMGVPYDRSRKPTFPSPSPDGERVAFALTTSNWGPRLSILNLGTGTVDALEILGMRVRWSPRGDWIAFLDSSDGLGPIKLMRPDGSGQQFLLPGLVRSWGGFEWSPDGEWIITGGTRAQLIHIDSRMSIPLPFWGYMVSAAWQFTN